MFSKTVTVCLLLLGTVDWTWAEGSGDAFPSAGSFSNPSESNSEDVVIEEKQSNFPQIPFLPDFGSMFSGSEFPSFPGFGGFNFPGFGGFEGSRFERSIQSEENNDSEQQRFFFKFPAIVNCNATTQSSRSCISCNQALTCNSNNVGFLRTCRGLFRHCDGGSCSLFQSSACSGAAATTTAAPTEATTTTAPTITTAVPGA